MYFKCRKEKTILGTNHTRDLCFNDSEASESLVFYERHKKPHEKLLKGEIHRVFRFINQIRKERMR